MKRQPHFESDREQRRHLNRLVWRDVRVVIIVTLTILAAMAVALMKGIMYP